MDPAAGWISQTLPGPPDAVSAPTALANSASLMNVFFTTSSGQIGNDYWTPAAGWASQTLPGPPDAVSAPTALANSSSLMNVFFTTFPARSATTIGRLGRLDQSDLAGSARRGQRPDGAGELVVADERVLHHLLRPDRQRLLDPSAAGPVRPCRARPTRSAPRAALANSSSLMNVFFTTSSGQIGNDYWTPAAAGPVRPCRARADAVSAPTALANSSSLMNVFFTTSSGQIGNDYWTPRPGGPVRPCPEGSAPNGDRFVLTFRSIPRDDHRSPPITIGCGPVRPDPRIAVRLDDRARQFSANRSRVMYASVRSNFISFTTPLEGSIAYMYLDVKEYLTIGIGNLIDPVALALPLPFVHKSEGTTGVTGGNPVRMAENQSQHCVGPTGSEGRPRR